jgi:hypothetical protein
MRKGEFMTKFFVDDREIVDLPKFTSIDQLLKHVEKSHLQSGMVIRRILIDGNIFAPDTLDGSLVDTIESREKIEIFTGTLKEIVKESIDEALEYLVRVEKATMDLSVRFQDFPDADAFQNLRQLYEGYYFISLLLEKLAASYHIKLEDAFVRDVSVQEHLRKFISVLKQLNECMQNGDYSLIADILEYEILPGVPVWQEIFTFMLNKITMTQ